MIPPTGDHLSVDQLRFVGAVAEAAADNDHDILLSPSGESREAAFDRMVGERRVDGVIVMETLLHDARVARLLTSLMPFVTIGRTGADQSHGWVDLDYAGLVDQAVRKLHAHGHRRLALINRPQALLDREYGPAFRALDAFGKTVAELDLHGRAVCCEDDEAAGAACVAGLLAGAEPVTGIVAINERSLAGVLRGARECGTRIPDDLSGRHAVEALLRRVAEPSAEPPHILLAPSFVTRRTLAAAPSC